MADHVGASPSAIRRSASRPIARAQTRQAGWTFGASSKVESSTRESPRCKFKRVDPPPPAEQRERRLADEPMVGRRQVASLPERQGEGPVGPPPVLQDRPLDIQRDAQRRVGQHVHRRDVRGEPDRPRLRGRGRGRGVVRLRRTLGRRGASGVESGFVRADGRGRDFIVRLRVSGASFMSGKVVRSYTISSRPGIVGRSATLPENRVRSAPGTGSGGLVGFVLRGAFPELGSFRTRRRCMRWARSRPAQGDPMP